MGRWGRAPPHGERRAAAPTGRPQWRRGGEEEEDENQEEEEGGCSGAGASGSPPGLGGSGRRWVRAPRPAVFCARLAAGGVGSRGGVWETGCGRTPRRLAQIPAPKSQDFGVWAPTRGGVLGTGAHRAAGSQALGLALPWVPLLPPLSLFETYLFNTNFVISSRVGFLETREGRFGTAHFHFFFKGGIKIVLHFFVVKAWTVEVVPELPVVMAAHVAAPEGCRVLAAWGEGSCRDGQAPGGQVSLGAGQRQVLVKAAIEDLPTPRACFKAPQVVLGLWPKRFYHPGSCSLPFKPLFDPFVSFVFFQSYWGHGLYLMVAVVKLFNCNVKIFYFQSCNFTVTAKRFVYVYVLLRDSQNKKDLSQE